MFYGASMNLIKKNITYSTAKEISSWKYSDEYAIYSFNQSEEVISDILNNDYYAIYDDNELIGYYCTGLEAHVPHTVSDEIYADNTYIDMGLGMKPSLTGNGYGREFVGFVINCIEQSCETDKMRLTVAVFNKRAIKVYKTFGFTEIKRFTRDKDNMEFMIMVNKI